MKHRFHWGALLAMASSLAAGAESADYEALLERARAGDHAPFLHAMDGQSLAARILYDYLAVAGWAGRSADVTRAYEARPVETLIPSYALLPVARAYRDQQRWQPAMDTFEEGARRFPQEGAYRYGFIMAQADAGDVDHALRGAKVLVAERPRDADARLALAYVYGVQGEYFSALEETDRAHELAPDIAHVRREYILALRRVRMAEAALRAARATPAVVDAPLMRTLQGDAAAELSRLSALPSRGEAERFVVADRALAMFDTLMAEWRTLGAEGAPNVLRARVDRIPALHTRVRMPEIVREYESLVREGIELPAYALSNVASAYLYVREPEKALDIYQRSLGYSSVARVNEAWNEDEVGLYYAFLESESLDASEQVVGAALARQQIWREVNGQDARMPNDFRLSMERLRGLAYLYANDTRLAQAEFDRLTEDAPNNSALLAGKAQVQRSRMLPRNSEYTLKMAETLAPLDRSVLAGQASTAMALQEWQKVRQLRDNLVERFPEDAGVQLLDQEWQVHQKAELRVSGDRGLKNGTPLVGDDAKGVEAVLYTPPISDNWRLLVGAGRATSEFSEGSARYRWARAGVQWRGRDLTWEADVSSNRYGQGERLGWSVAGAYDLNDHWQAGAGAARHSRATPLRALNSAIHADRLDAFVRWRADERREWRMALSPSKFSDGNRRWEWAAQGTERLFTAPRWWLDGLLEVAASRNSAQGAPYFNPRSDLTLLPAVRASHILYRRYETVWEHQLTLGAGVYQQRDFASGPISSWSYGHRYRTHQVFEAGVSVSGQRRPFDGVRERSLRVDFDFVVRF